MLEKEQIFASNQPSRLLGLAVLLLQVALESPVIVHIAHAIVAEPAHLLPLADWGGLAPRRVQILPRLVVLQAHQIAAANRLARPTGLIAQLVSLSHREQRSLVVLWLRLEGHDLLSSATTVVRVYGGKEEAALGVLQAQARRASHHTFV